jgi:hypothetical protein
MKLFLLSAHPSIVPTPSPAPYHSPQRLETYLSSGPPSFLTIFLNEKIVPNINFASSCALNLAGLALAGPRSGAGALMAEALTVLAPEIGLEGLV